MRNKINSLNITTANHSIGEQAIKQVYTQLQNTDKEILNENWQANLHLYCHLLTASELNNLTNELKKAKHAYYDQHATACTQAEITKMLEILALNQQTLAAKTQSYSSVANNKRKCAATAAKTQSYSSVANNKAKCTATIAKKIQSKIEFKNI